MFKHDGIVISVLAWLLLASACVGGQSQVDSNVDNPFRTTAVERPVQDRGHVRQAVCQLNGPMPIDDDSWNSPVLGCGDILADAACEGRPCVCRTCQRSCGPTFWAEADYLLWQTKSMRVPALATTSTDETADNPGALDDPATSILFGDTEMNDGAQSGGRFELGMWLNPSQCNGIEVSYLFLDEEQTSFHGSQDDYTILARPFYNVESSEQDARLIDFPDLVEGSLDISVETSLQTLAVMYRATTIRSRSGCFSVFGGYRFAELDDDVTISESTLSLSGPTAGTTYDLYDAFATRNTFHGSEWAIEFEQQLGCLWWGEMAAKAALGSTRSRTQIAGQTSETTDGTTTTHQGGLLTQATNLGEHGRTNTSSILEFDVTLRRKLSRCTTLVVGYDVVFWTKVLRAGDQIDLEVNPTQIPPRTLVGEARPAFPNAASTYWAQGLRFGFEARF
jgi:hypothetical protein